jgi:hypothetical protein
MSITNEQVKHRNAHLVSKTTEQVKYIYVHLVSRTHEQVKYRNDIWCLETMDMLNTDFTFSV